LGGFEVTFLVMLLLLGVAVGSFFYWYGFETAELKFMPYLDCDYLLNDLDYYDRAQAEWVHRCRT